MAEPDSARPPDSSCRRALTEDALALQLHRVAQAGAAVIAGGAGIALRQGRCWVRPRRQHESARSSQSVDEVAVVMSQDHRSRGPLRSSVVVPSRPEQSALVLVPSRRSHLHSRAPGTPGHPKQSTSSQSTATVTVVVDEDPCTSLPRPRADLRNPRDSCTASPSPRSPRSPQKPDDRIPLPIGSGNRSRSTWRSPSG